MLLFRFSQSSRPFATLRGSKTVSSSLCLFVFFVDHSGSVFFASVSASNPRRRLCVSACSCLDRKRLPGGIAVNVQAVEGVAQLVGAGFDFGIAGAVVIERAQVQRRAIGDR